MGVSLCPPKITTIFFSFDVNDVKMAEKKQDRERNSVLDLEDPTPFADSSEKVGKTCGVERSSGAVLAEECLQHGKQSWDCSQLENEPQERCDGLGRE